MTAPVHIVHLAPADPVRLRKAAQDRLRATALRIRQARLERLFREHGLVLADVLEIEGASARPRSGLELPAEQVADLTRAVRALETRKIGNAGGWRDDEPRELARKISDYLRAEDYLAGRGRRWIETLLQRHAGPPAFGNLNRASQELLRRGAGPLPLVGPLTDHAIDELAARIHARAPWMAVATTVIWHQLRAARACGREGLALPPFLLHGPPGTGKSSLARIVAEESGAPVAEIDAGTGTAGFRIAGVEAGWSSRQVGDVVRLVCDGRAANPVMIVNELDKIGGGMSASRGTRTSMADALLPLLEPTTAGRFRCPASGLDHDLSRVVWIVTANRIDRIDPVLLSRFEPVEVPALGRAELDLFIDVAIPVSDREAVRRILTGIPVGPRLTLRHVRRLADRLVGTERADPLH